MIELHISSDLALPVNAVTQTLVVYGGKGMGKTNFGSVFVEELYAASRRFSVIDPMGVWWGLQHGRGRGDRGLEVLLLGGIHGDLPIEPASGDVVADLVADESISVVIDISRRADGKAWSKGEKVRFVTSYMTRLYERQVEHRRPLMQIIDEAARYAPQKLMSGETDVAACLGIIATVCEEGRNLGIGLTLLTQRSARLNKDVAELADMLIAFRVVGPNSVAAVLDWFGEHVPKERHKSLVEQLRKLPVGTALIVSPGWLDFEGAAKIRERETFDSSATPTGDHVLQAPGGATKPDLQKYRDRMAATIEKAKADNPKVLKKRIAELERELKTVEVRPAQPDRSIVERAVHEATQRLQAEHDNHASMLELEIARLRREIQSSVDNLSKAIQIDPPKIVRAAAVLAAPNPAPPRNPSPTAVKRPVEARPPEGGLKISATQQRVLDALAWYESIGIPEPSNLQIGAIALIDSSGGHFSNVVGPLSSNGLVERRGRAMRLTAAGRAGASIPDNVATLSDYHDVLRSRVRRVRSASGKTVEMLNAIIAAGGAEITAVKIGQAVGIDHTGGHFSNTIGPLGTLGLIERSRGTVRPTEILFPPGLD